MEVEKSIQLFFSVRSGYKKKEMNSTVSLILHGKLQVDDSSAIHRDVGRGA